MTNDAGILQLMDDLGNALAGVAPIAMFGGGNPAQIPDVTKIYGRELKTICEDPARLATMLGNYDTPQGNAEFITAVTEFLNRHYHLDITTANIAITPGSQTGYFMLFNILAGRTGERRRKILFPLVPEYIGYVDQGLEIGMFESRRPIIQKISEREFKYAIDFDALELGEDIAAVCISRPTNPTGNVVTDGELERLGHITRERDMLMLIDNAYGAPFPNVIVPETKLFWNDHTVLSMTLSKVGLPGSRVGIFVGPPKLMKALTSANAIVSLASPNFGQYLAKPLIQSDEVLSLSRESICPFYFERADRARKLMNKHFPSHLPWRLHRYEGSYFFWLWLEGSRLSGMQLYDWLKERGVIVVPGEYFFPGQDIHTWAHGRECLRLNFSRSDDELEKGIPILAEAIEKAYAAG